MSVIIHFKMGEDFFTPWPVGVDDDNNVVSGLGRDDGAWLVGFGPLGEQHVTVLTDQALEDPARVVGLVPTFSKEGGFFEWQCVVSEMLVYPPEPPKGDNGDTPGGDATDVTT